MRHWLPLALVALAACEGASAQDPVEVTLDMLPCASEALSISEAWESAPWPPGTLDACAWMPFDGDTSYRVSHGLGRVPRVVLVYISFDSDGRASNVAPGDATRIISVDDSVVEIRNAQEQDFFAKVVLQ